MLNISCGAKPDWWMSSWIQCCSCFTTSGFTEPALPCCFICFRPIQFLYQLNHPSLRASCSSSSTPTISAKTCHFWWRTPPVSNTPSLHAFTTHRSIISVTSGWHVLQAHLAEWATPSSAAYPACHFASSLTQEHIKGCLRQSSG